MKLVKLLARELEEWPEGADAVTQDDDGDLNACPISDPEYGAHIGQWMADGGLWIFDNIALASDHATAIITRVMWQAERDKLKGEKVMQDCVEKCAATESYAVYDIRTMRDRIHAIDAASKEEEARHCVAMEAFDKERAGLVAKLKAEGLALVEREEVPSEDMSDWRNWKPGDLLKVVCEKEGHEFDIGEIVRVRTVYLGEENNDTPISCENMDGRDYWFVCAEEVEWHSRPPR